MALCFVEFLAVALCFSLRNHVVGDGIMRTRNTRIFNSAKVLFILLKVVVQGHQKSFCVYRSKQYALTHGGTLLARQSLSKVKDELRWGVGNDCQIAVSSLGYLVAD